MVKTEQDNKNRTGFFRFKKRDKGYLITNDTGNFCALTDRQFEKFINGTLDEKSPVYNRLAEKSFIFDRLDLQASARAYRQRYQYLLCGPTLHIVVVTLRCNYKCVYCQANRRDADLTEYDMTKATAKNVVDRIFESPAKSITIEFQGGEPLMNWPVIKFIVEYALKKNIKEKKDLLLALVTNLSLMSNDIYDFLISHGVSICTSLDGPEQIHNQNRPCPNRNSYKATTEWIKKIWKKEEREPGNNGRDHRVNALLTITRSSLQELRKTIDEYIAFGFRNICLRPVSYLGLSGGAVQKKIGYTAEEFIEAWRDAMEYILDINKRGRFFTERLTKVFLQKILTPCDPGFLDLRSPCGAGIGQMAYNYDGKVYTCDEARMLEDDTFLLGDANQQDYQQIASSPRIKTVLLSSTLENFSCDECVYKPYCGTCPVVNLVRYGTLFPQIRSTDNCKINSAMLDYIFEKMRYNSIVRIFKEWVEKN